MRGREEACGIRRGGGRGEERKVGASRGREEGIIRGEGRKVRGWAFRVQVRTRGSGIQIGAAFWGTGFHGAYGDKKVPGYRWPGRFWVQACPGGTV